MKACPACPLFQQAEHDLWVLSWEALSLSRSTQLEIVNVKAHLDFEELEGTAWFCAYHIFKADEAAKAALQLYSLNVYSFTPSVL